MQTPDKAFGELHATLARTPDDPAGWSAYAAACRGLGQAGWADLADRYAAAGPDERAGMEAEHWRTWPGAAAVRAARLAREAAAAADQFAAAVAGVKAATVAMQEGFAAALGGPGERIAPALVQGRAGVS